MVEIIWKSIERNNFFPECEVKCWEWFNNRRLDNLAAVSLPLAAYGYVAFFLNL